MSKKILIINPFGIGDVLFTTPLIHTLKDAFPGVGIGYLCNRRSLAVLENNLFLDYLFVYERDEFEAVRRKSFFLWLGKINLLLNEIKKERFEVCLDFSLNRQYGFFSWYCGIPERIGYDFKNRGNFLTKKIRLSGYTGKHVIEYYLGLLKFLNLEVKYRNPEFYLKEEDLAWAEQFLADKQVDVDNLLVVLIPAGGKSWGKDSYLKHWPVENFARLADKIVEKYKATIIILGDSSEKEICSSLKNNMHYGALDLSGEITINQLGALISKAGLVITNDGGPLHIAVALGRKTLSFFGPVDPAVYGPYPLDPQRHAVLFKELDCRPCYQNFRLKTCSKDRLCLKGITLQDAEEALAKLLNLGE